MTSSSKVLFNMADCSVALLENVTRSLIDEESIALVALAITIAPALH